MLAIDRTILEGSGHNGVTRFGTTSSCVNPKISKPILDIILGQSIKIGDASKTNFIIKYRPEFKGYYLKDSGEGTGTFVRLDHPYVPYHILIINTYIGFNQWIFDFFRRIPPGRANDTE